MLTTKIGAIDAQYPYLPQVRSWSRWQGSALIEPAEIVGLYITTKFKVVITPLNSNMAFLDQLISKWIDSGRITPENCPELFAGAKCKN